MTRKLYPIGIQTFERIRQENNVYIDKTRVCVSHDSCRWQILLP